MLPDIAGFEDAMRRLRQATGREVVFHIPQAPQYPPGTRLDRETGEPMDPTIQPLAGTGGFADVMLKVGVVYKDESRLRPGGDVRDTAIGPMSGADEILDVDFDDWPQVEDATEVTDLATRYNIVEAKPTGLTGEDRVLVYIEEQ